MEENGSGTALTVRQMLFEIREDIKALSDKLDALDKRGLGTKDKLSDHEDRLRLLERWRYSVPVVLVIAIMATTLDLALK